MIYILYLAAGYSRRYGAENKLTDLHGGKPLYVWGLQKWQTATHNRNDCSLTVVTCWQEIEETCQKMGIRAIHCPDSHIGISHTIRCGIRSLPPLTEDDYLCFSVADQPNLTENTITRLLDATKEKPLTACVSCQGEMGNPTLFSVILADELLQLTGDKGGKAVMRRHPKNHIDIPCNPSELLDIDIKTTAHEGNADSIEKMYPKG